MKKKIIDFLTNLWEEIEHRLRLMFCYASPMKQFIIVLVFGGALAVANIYFISTSIYNLGKRDAETEFMKLQHIEPLELPQKEDSIFPLSRENYDMEYLQHNKNNDGHEYE